jgi:uncharacterized protein with ParB-like and HNH nuclease domain
MSELLYNIRDLFSEDGYLSQQDKTHYFIPLYQRGYKWEPKHVTKLLDDINQFNNTDDKFYCLQNITIVPRQDKFHVVDGQQRLTTLSLILNYLGEKALVRGKVKFPTNSIRDYTNKFLDEVVFESPELIIKTKWKDYIGDNAEYDHQDIHHMFLVFQSIDKWFQQRPDHFSKEDFLDKLLDSVMVIMNQVNDESNEEKIFGNLNSKRIPLDGADLIRAMLITRVVYEEGKKETDIKNIVRINERRIKIGWIIDQINNWWSLEKVRGYFSGVVSKNDKKYLQEVNFNFDRHPINLLYFLFARSHKNSLSIEFFEEKSNKPTLLYREIIKLHETLKDWFQDREIYHYLGYLINQSETDFSSIWKAWLDSTDRVSFKLSLKIRIKRTLMEEKELVDFSNTSVNWYEKNKSSLVKGLILMDVIHALKNNQAFIPHNGFIKNANDIEHIFPQVPEDQEDKKAYVEFLNEYVVEGGKHKLNIGKEETRLSEEKLNEKMDQFINRIIEGYHIHSIGNLVLLNRSLNRSISNSHYSYKRARVIDFHNKGNYIQPHTFHVFVRYFNDDKNENKDFEHWSQKDIRDNSGKIDSTIKEFFKDVEE